MSGRVTLRHHRAMTARRLLATALLGLSLIAGTPTVRVDAATKKPSASKPVFTPQRLAGTYRWVKSTVKVTFAKGAYLKDPASLFNASLDGNARRAIDIHEAEEVDESDFKALFREAVALNSSGRSKLSKKAKS